MTSSFHFNYHDEIVSLVTPFVVVEGGINAKGDFWNDKEIEKCKLEREMDLEMVNVACESLSELFVEDKSLSGALIAVRLTLKVLRAKEFYGLPTALLPWLQIRFTEDLRDVDVFTEEKQKKKKKKKGDEEKQVEREMEEAEARTSKDLMKVIHFPCTPPLFLPFLLPFFSPISSLFH